MNANEFRKQAHEMVDWIADYLDGGVEKLPVRAQVKPNEIYNQLAPHAPEQGEPMANIFEDFKNIVMPGITHWQHPNFHAYFPANSSYPSLLAEMLMSTLAAQCMLWETSPAATEMETRVMEWIRDLIGLPSFFEGSIQNSASSSTLLAILSAREKFSNFEINQQGIQSKHRFRVYASEHIHSSIEKAVRIAGIGSVNYRPIKTNDAFSMDPKALEKAITEDLQNGFTPLCVVAGLGTTSSTGIDPIDAIGAICKQYQIWFHVDAAYAGTAMLLPEMQHMIKGVDQADSFVFNPHKWMFTNFDCSVYYVKDRNALLKSFSILPEYLKTETGDSVINYKDWGIQLGRRFRALKLWFVIRHFGAEGLRVKIRLHLQLTQNLKKQMEAHPDFELLAPVDFNLICFRFNPKNKTEEELDILNEKILHALNHSGEIYITHTKLNGKYTLRMVIGQTNVAQRHVDNAWRLIQEEAKQQ